MRTYNLTGRTPKWGQPNVFTDWVGVLTINTDRTEYIVECKYTTAYMSQNEFKLYAKYNNLSLTLWT